VDLEEGICELILLEDLDEVIKCLFVLDASSRTSSANPLIALNIVARLVWCWQNRSYQLSFSIMGSNCTARSLNIVTGREKLTGALYILGGNVKLCGKRITIDGFVRGISQMMALRGLVNWYLLEFRACAVTESTDEPLNSIFFSTLYFP